MNRYLSVYHIPWKIVHGNGKNSPVTRRFTVRNEYNLYYFDKIYAFVIDGLGREEKLRLYMLAGKRTVGEKNFPPKWTGSKN